MIKEIEYYSLNKNDTEITKYYFDNYKIIKKISNYNGITYEKISYFRNGKLIFLRRGFINKLKTYVDKLIGDEYNLLMNCISKYDIKSESSDIQNMLYEHKNNYMQNIIENIIDDNKKYKFMFSYKPSYNNLWNYKFR